MNSKDLCNAHIHSFILLTITQILFTLLNKHHLTVGKFLRVHHSIFSPARGPFNYYVDKKRGEWGSRKFSLGHVTKGI